MWFLCSELQLSALHGSHFGKNARGFFFIFFLNVIFWLNVFFEVYH